MAIWASDGSVLPNISLVKKLTVLLLVLLVLGPASAQPAAAQTNSFVRFRFFHGSTVVGDVTVELFDQDKPVTVQNFLRYVREGSYDNLILHRCVPNFVIQAGMARSINPSSSSVFDGYMPTVTHEAITNEFEVGPRLANVFGTLAMAKVADQPNSATSDWFFNLANNSATLDATNGGFTVFGRVVSGTNVLNFFNRTSRSLGISGVFSAPFGELPVAYNPTAGRYPRFSEMYHVQVTPLGGPADSTRPTLKIISPAVGARLSNGTVTVTGTASDNRGVGMVWYSLNNGDQTNASGTTNWSATVALERVGTNRFWAQSVDTGGRRSPFVSQTLFWSVPQPIGVQQIGSGIITGPTNGQMLELTKIYTITAAPAARHKFLNWVVTTVDLTNSLTTPRVSFFMRSNMSWTATFVTNPFPPLAGMYVGAGFNTNFITYNTNFINYNDTRLAESLNALTLKLTDQGAFSGKVRQGKAAYPFSGSFLADGRTRISVPRTGLVPLILKLTNENARITGTVSDDTIWTSWVQAERAATGTAAQPTRWTGRYTVALPGGTDATLAPPGNGPGAVTVSSAGSLSLIGTLPDGTPLTYSTPVSTNGTWPLYVPLYRGKGGLFAWSQFDTSQPSESLSGLYVWIKRDSTATKLYTNGFVITNLLAGSAYRVPAGNTNRVLSLTNGVLVLSDGGLAAPATNEIALSARNLVTNLSTNKLTLTINKANGLFSGKETPPGAAKAVTFKGVVLQNQNSGTGYFINSNSAGSVYFGP